METKRKSRFRWALLDGMFIPLLVGIPFFGFGAYEFYQTARMVSASMETEGIVVGNYFDYEAYRPEVKFTTEDGEVVRFTDGVGTYPAAFEEGETVSVIYDPENVRDARINRLFRIWFAPVLFMTVGVLPVLTMFGWYMYRGASFRAKRKKQLNSW